MATVLIAGEDWTSMDNMAATIGSEGHRVLTAATGLDAYEMTLAEQPDLVMLEVSMPVFDGFETCEMLRGDPEIPPTLPIVFMLSEDVDTRRLEQVGATDQVSKSIVSVELRDLLVKLLGDKAAGDPET